MGPILVQGGAGEPDRLPAVSDPRSTWSPLRHTIFRWLWIASVASNVGTWFQNVGASWLMTTLSPSPVLVALVQAATSLPMFLLSLPAGAVADVLDRRRLLILTQAWMTLAAFGLWAFTAAGATTPGVLLGFTFLLGLGAALNGPAWQASIPEMVPREDLPAAVTLGSIGFNIARALGPALAGLIVASAGVGGHLPGERHLLPGRADRPLLLAPPGRGGDAAGRADLGRHDHGPALRPPRAGGARADLPRLRVRLLRRLALGPPAAGRQATSSSRAPSATACSWAPSAWAPWRAPWSSPASSGTTRWTAW